MPSESDPEPAVSDPFSPTPGGDVGHSGAEWDIPEEEDLTEVQLRAIELTIQGHNDVTIAQHLNIDRKTLWRWKTLDDEYRRVLSNARIQLYAAASDRYQRLLGKATSVLSAFLEDKSEQNRFRAATVFLNMAGCFRPLPPSYFPPKPPPDPNNDDDWPMPDLPPKVG